MNVSWIRIILLIFPPPPLSSKMICGRYSAQWAEYVVRSMLIPCYVTVRRFQVNDFLSSRYWLARLGWRLEFTLQRSLLPFDIILSVYFMLHLGRCREDRCCTRSVFPFTRAYYIFRIFVNEFKVRKQRKDDVSCRLLRRMFLQVFGCYCNWRYLK